MPIHDLCFKSVITVSKDTSLEDAAKKMKNERVGVLVVTDRTFKAVGIVTDRDIVLGGIAEGKSMNVPVSEIMTTDVLHVPKNTGVADVIDKMERREVRRAVVVEKNGRPCGLVSTDDLLQLLGNELHSLGNLVGRQVIGEGLYEAV